jgi:arachidonate 15-lipoxygenase
VHFVGRYVRLYYEGSADIVSDAELQACIECLGDPEQAGLGGVPKVETIDELVRFVATFLWIGSAQHGALNYAQFPYFGYAPNVPGALYAAAPTHATPDDALSWMAMLPPIHQAVLQLTVLYQLSSVHYDRLGHYPAMTFVDPRVAPLVREFQQRLVQAESEMKDNDARRLLPYPYMRPSQIGNSVYI